MAATPWLDEKEERAWRGWVRMRAELGAVLDRDLQASTGLSIADYAVLVELSEAPDGQMRPFELGRALSWEKSRLSHHLRRMARRGLVDRQSCPTDARGLFVVLTPEGRRAIEAAAPLHVAQVRSYFLDVLTPDQIEVMGEVAENVLEHLGRTIDGLCQPESALAVGEVAEA